MKRIYDFARCPAARNHTMADLQALKGSDRKLSVSNPANTAGLQACIAAAQEVDLAILAPV